MEKNPKSESYIIKEAENVIENYLKTRENKENNLLKEKYERLKITSIAMGIVGLIGILISVIFKIYIHKTPRPSI